MAGTTHQAKIKRGKIMKKEQDKHIALRIDKEILDKFKYIAEYEGRSCNGQLKYMISQRIAKFEEEHGKINLNENN